MTDLSARALHDAAVACGRHAELFEEDELVHLHVIAVRIEHGMALTANQRDLLVRCAARVRQHNNQTEGARDGG